MRGSGAVGVPPRCSPHDHHRQVLHHLPRSEGEDVEEPRTLSKLDLHLVREWYDKKDKELEETRGEAYITPAACTGLFPYVRTGTGLFLSLFPSVTSLSTGPMSLTRGIIKAKIKLQQKWLIRVVFKKQNRRKNRLSKQATQWLK